MQFFSLIVFNMFLAIDPKEKVNYRPNLSEVFFDNYYIKGWP